MSWVALQNMPAKLTLTATGINVNQVNWRCPSRVQTCDNKIMRTMIESDRMMTMIVQSEQVYCKRKKQGDRISSGNDDNKKFAGTPPPQDALSSHDTARI